MDQVDFLILIKIQVAIHYGNTQDQNTVRHIQAVLLLMKVYIDNQIRIVQYHRTNIHRIPVRDNNIFHLSHITVQLEVVTNI